MWALSAICFIPSLTRPPHMPYPKTPARLRIEHVWGSEQGVDRAARAEGDNARVNADASAGGTAVHLSDTVLDDLFATIGLGEVSRMVTAS